MGADGTKGLPAEALEESGVMVIEGNKSVTIHQILQK
jgi:hypothetical protein